MDIPGGDDVEAARLARRSLLKKAAIAGAAAWTAPLVLQSVTNPAGALTCAQGSYHVVYEEGLVQRTPTANTGCTHSGTNTTAAAIGLSVSFGTSAAGTCGSTNASIAHIASDTGNCRPVVISVAGGCECTITSVWAHVHNRSANNCPQQSSNYCWNGGQARTGMPAGRIPLRIVSGAFGTSAVTVQPNYNNSTVCSGEDGIHWGSPNAEDGYLVVNVTCTG